jgi:hypothetical protein
MCYYEANSVRNNVGASATCFAAKTSKFFVSMIVFGVCRLASRVRLDGST